MPQSRDTDESRSDADRALLVDLLYGELPEPEVARVRERMDGDDELQSEFDAFGRIHDMMSALPDEEPPPAISAKLLHAAAQQVASTTPAVAASSSDEEPSGIWAWVTSLFRPLVMYPGLAAATSLVLVVGIAGTLYISDRVAPEDHAIASVEQSPAAAPTSSASKKAEDSSAAAAEPEFATGEAQPALADEEQAEDELSDGAQQQKPVAAPEAKNASDRDAPGNTLRRARIDALEGDVGNVQGAFKSGIGGAEDAPAETAPARSAGPRPKKRPSKRSRRAADKKAGKSLPGQSLDIGLEEPELEPVPNSPAPEPDAAGEDVEPAAEKERQERPRRTRGATKNKDQTSSSSRLRSLLDEARDAARTGDCDSVRSIGQRVLEIDRTYYQEQFRRDKTLSRCFGKKR